MRTEARQMNTDATEHRAADLLYEWGPHIALVGLLVFGVVYGLVAGSWFPLAMVPVGFAAGVIGALTIGR